jgi:hypothetical protein
MLERHQGLDHLEQTACLIAERTLGAIATPYDVAGRQGAVEAFLDYPDGRRAAFEVTQLATDGGASHQLGELPTETASEAEPVDKPETEQNKGIRQRRDWGQPG